MKTCIRWCRQADQSRIWCSRRRNRQWSHNGSRLMLQTISLLLENKPGALLRVTGVLAARGYNIESLTVAKTLDPELSRMTIVVDVEERLKTQVIKQMNKLINVLHAADMDDAPSVIREMVLVRVRCAQETRTAVLQEAGIFHARVVDSSVEGFAIEA